MVGGKSLPTVRNPASAGFLIYTTASNCYIVGMPAYEYRQPDGSMVTRVLPVEQRDQYPGRVTVPRSIAFVGSAYDPTISANRIREGYKAMEAQGKFIKTHKRVYERAWGSHDTKTVMRGGKAVNVV